MLREWVLIEQEGKATDYIKPSSFSLYFYSRTRTRVLFVIIPNYRITPIIEFSNTGP